MDKADTWEFCLKIMHEKAWIVDSSIALLFGLAGHSVRAELPGMQGLDIAQIGDLNECCRTQDKW